MATKLGGRWSGQYRALERTLPGAGAPSGSLSSLLLSLTLIRRLYRWAVMRNVHHHYPLGWGTGKFRKFIAGTAPLAGNAAERSAAMEFGKSQIHESA